MKEKLIEKVVTEYKEKLQNIDASNIAIYTMITTYVINEELNNHYVAYLLKHDNTLNYLYDAYLDMKAKQNHYEFVRSCLDIDQAAFLNTQLDSEI